MKKIKLKIPAKINLTLDVVGAENGFHKLKTIVTSVNVYDFFTIKKRKDNQIRVIFDGMPIYKEWKQSLTYQAVDIFSREYNVDCGVDVFVNRTIPSEAGLGGSSADVAGVLNGLKILFDVGEDMTKIANRLGSDTAYMLRGGFCKLLGRGEIIEPLHTDMKLYALILTEEKGVSTGACYAEYDRQGKSYEESADKVQKCLENGDSELLLKLIKNDLYNSAISINSAVERNLNALKEYGTAIMTGSGSAVYGLFVSKKQRDLAYKTLKDRCGERLIKAETL